MVQAWVLLRRLLSPLGSRLGLISSFSPAHPVVVTVSLGVTEMEASCRSESNGAALVRFMVEVLAAETVLAAQRSLFCLLLAVGSLSTSVGVLGEESDLTHMILGKSKPETIPENKDDGESDDDEDGGDDDDEYGDGKEDDGGEDFSDEEGNDDGDEEGDDPQANGGGSEEEDDEEEDEDDEDDGEEEDEDDEDEDGEEDIPQPPSKKKK